MMSVKYPRVANIVMLTIFSKHFPELCPLVFELRKSYNKYYKNAGNPIVLSPMSIIEDKHVTCFEKLFRSGYDEKKNDKYKLNWLYFLRNNENLPCCPMCGNNGVDAIDHYLAKEDYPEFYVLSYNLVPTCTACNSKRGRYANSQNAEHALLHPYFDGNQLNSALVVVEIFGKKSLCGEVSYEMPTFKLVSNIDDTHPLSIRLINHLKKCVDDVKFRRAVKCEWAIWRRKGYMYNTGYELMVAVCSELDAVEKTAGMNSWRAAFLRGLSIDENVLKWIVKNPIF